MKGCIALLSAILITGTAHANDVWLTSTIKMIYPQADGSYILRFVTDSAECTNANSPKYYAVRVGENGMTQDGSTRLYAAALTAAALGKQVAINFSDTTTSCYINRMFVLDLN